MNPTPRTSIAKASLAKAAEAVVGHHSQQLPMEEEQRISAYIRLGFGILCSQLPVFLMLKITGFQGLCDVVSVFPSSEL